jgi:hypothetical protein
MPYTATLARVAQALPVLLRTDRHVDVIHAHGNQRNQHAAQTPIAVQVGVDGFELGMHQSNPDQRREIIGRMDVAFEIA